MTNLPQNTYKSEIIRQRLFLEAGYEGVHGVSQKPYFWVVVPEADTKRGKIVLKNFKETETDVAPHPIQIEFAKELLERLQRTTHHDGIWIVGWTHPPDFSQIIRVDGDNVWSRLIMIWLDKDADPQFTLDSEMPVAQMVENGSAYYANLAEDAYETFMEEYSEGRMKEEMGLSDDQMTKAVLSSLN